MSLPTFVPEKLFYRQDEVATWLGVTARTVKRWMGQGVFGRTIPTAAGERITYDGLLSYYHEGDPRLKSDQ